MGYYIGLMSGTSADGIDAAVIDLTDHTFKLIGSRYEKYPQFLRREILDLCQSGNHEIARMGALDHKLGKRFAEATNQLLQQLNLHPSQVTAIGSHGQTIRHQPETDHPFTLQIGDPNIIASETMITTVADFRRKDIALGGQGAPLVPAFHQWLWGNKGRNRVIINIGGMANITLLFKTNAQLLGFDTGPGNVLLDTWSEVILKQAFDKNGAWAAKGRVDEPLLQKMLLDPYFKKKPPKSTGREKFNLNWLQQFSLEALPPEDVQATLTELTVKHIIDSIREHMDEGDLYVCGGGAFNQHLMQRLKAQAEPAYSVHTTETQGLPPDQVEACAFAWLAQQTLMRKTANVPSVTQAKYPSILGGIYYP